jgi:hypothetical protein
LAGKKTTQMRRDEWYPCRWYCLTIFAIQTKIWQSAGDTPDNNWDKHIIILIYSIVIISSNPLTDTANSSQPLAVVQCAVAQSSAQSAMSSSASIAGARQEEENWLIK